MWQYVRYDATILCLLKFLGTVTTENNHSVVYIHRVKLSETKAKGQEGYRKNKTWRLKELKAVDGKDERQVFIHFV